MSLESDGSISIYEIETGNVIAEYEGLEIHKLVISVKELIENCVVYDDKCVCCLGYCKCDGEHKHVNCALKVAKESLKLILVAHHG